MSTQQNDCNQQFLGLRQRIIQLHPTLTCNLRCVHCYSGSGPRIKASLPAKLLCGVLEDAASLGYEAVSISGGEPLLYQDLEAVLRHARYCGLSATLTTNATLLNTERLAHLQPHLNGLAISLDGPPEMHNTMRRSSKAFDQMLAGLEVVKQSGIPFGFIHTLTHHSWEHLSWLADFAAGHGAKLLQIHPLEQVGRASTMLLGTAPDAVTLAKAYLISLALTQEYGDKMRIHLDAFRKPDLLQQPRLAYIPDFDVNAFPGSATDLLGILVVQADGQVLPLAYGIADKYAICNLHQQSLREAWSRYRQEGYRQFLGLCQDVFDHIEPTPLPFFDWHESVIRQSQITPVQDLILADGA